MTSVGDSQWDCGQQHAGQHPLHPLRAASLQYVLPHLTRVQPEHGLRTGTSAFSSSACGKRNLRTAGHRYRETQPERGTLGTVCSNATQNLMHFMDPHQGGLCASLTAFSLPGMHGSQVRPLPRWQPALQKRAAWMLFQRQEEKVQATA